MKNLTQIIEAIFFAAGTSKLKSDILSLLPNVSKKEFEKSLEELSVKYNKDNSGIVLLQFNGKIQFSTNPAYGETVAEVLTPLKEKELSKVLIESLAIIAYKQPITRLDLEKIKGTSAEYAISILTKTHLIEVVGRKEVVGRPVLYGTTDEFLKKFQLESIDDLPDYQAVMAKLEELGDFNKAQIELYRDIEIDENEWQRSPEPDSQQERLAQIDRSLNESSIIDDILAEEEEVPDFLDGEEFEVVE